MPIPVVASYTSNAEAFRNGTDSPRDFLERCIDRYNEWEPQIKAFVHVDLEAARKASDASTQRWRSQKPLSPIDGMPVGIKDIIETANLPTEQGSPLFIGWQSVRDSATVAALREAGAVVVGKTVTTEFAATEPGPTRNPWDLARTPGGSSSGSAAAVAAGIVSAALGTQVIGSIIRPAGYCGCYGYKTSLGGINRGGQFDYLSQSCAGVLAATLEELWIVAREMSSRVGGDPGFPGLSGPKTAASAKKPNALAVLRTAGFNSLSSDAAEQFEKAVAALKRAGIRVMSQDDSNAIALVEKAIHDAGQLSRSINAWESRWPLNTYARDMNRAGLSAAMQKRLIEAEAMTLEQNQAWLEERESARTIYARLSADFDACITLTAPGGAPLGIASTGDPIFAIPASLLGTPAAALPLLQADGLPLGLQVLGFRDRDFDMFATAAWLRDALKA